jgi:hypothetical protein
MNGLNERRFGHLQALGSFGCAPANVPEVVFRMTAAAEMESITELVDEAKSCHSYRRLHL